MSAKIPPQLRLAELEAKCVQTRRHLRVVKMALPRAVWASDADVRELSRRLKCLYAARSMQRLRVKDPERYRKQKRDRYAQTKVGVLRRQKVRYARDRIKILEAQGVRERQRRAERNSDPVVLQERAARKKVRAAKLSALMKMRMAEQFKDHVSVITPERKKQWRLKYEAKPGYKEKRQAYSQRPEVKKHRREKYRVIERERWHTDPQFALSSMLRCRIRSALLSQGQKKTARTEALIGCTVETFKAHLESKFLPGMTWSNRGEWHIDHKRPCASFDLTDAEQQRLCFHYTNMQPLWRLDNLRKGSKF